MKVQYNMSTESTDDLARFVSQEDFLEFSAAFDGVELMYHGLDERNIIPADKVVGYHLMYYITWMDLWRGDSVALSREFGNLKTAQQQYGSLNKQVLVDAFKADLARAHEYGAEYVVFHVSENYVDESFTFNYSKKDEDVARAACELVNEVFAEEDGSVVLLLENLWAAGLNYRSMEPAQILMDGVEYPNKGFMLDTGHLMHTNFDLNSPEQALAFVNQKIDEMEAAGIAQHVRGMHLHQGISSAFCKELMEHAQDFQGMSYAERQMKAYMNAFKIDIHEPFVCPGVEKMIERLPLEYLNFEFITSSRAQMEAYHKAQWSALPHLAQNRQAQHPSERYRSACNC